jgi:hypothetical protein
MNVVSAILRFVCGFTLIIAAWATHRRITAHEAAGEPMQIAGVTIGASPSQVSLGLWAIGLIGALLIILGIVTLTRKPGPQVRSSFHRFPFETCSSLACRVRSGG